MEVLKSYITELINRTNSSDNHMLFGWIIFLIILEFLNLIFDYFFNRKLSKQDYRNAVHSKKADLAIKCYNDMSRKLDDIQIMLNDSCKINQVSIKIKDTRGYLRKNSLNLSNNCISIVNALLDLFTIAAIDNSRREREKERKLLSKFKLEYERIENT